MDTTMKERLLQLIKEKKVTQKEIALQVGVTEAAMSHYLKGDRFPRASVLGKIANVLGTTTDYLLGGDAEINKSEIGYAKILIARNLTQMTPEEKIEIINLLTQKK